MYSTQVTSILCSRLDLSNSQPRINTVMKKLNRSKQSLVADYVVRLLDEAVDISGLDLDSEEADFAEVELPVIEYAIKLLQARKKENEKIIS
jgi:hypothetical protein